MPRIFLIGERRESDASHQRAAIRTPGFLKHPSFAFVATLTFALALACAALLAAYFPAPIGPGNSFTAAEA